MSSLKRFWATLIALLALSAPTPASAHPDLVLYIDTAANIQNQGQQLFLDYYVAKSQQFSFSEIAKLNGDLTAYANSECSSAVQNLKLSTGDFYVPLQLRVSIALENVVQTGAGAWIWCQFETEVRFYDVVEFSWQDLNYSGVDGHREFNLGKGTSPSKDLTDYSAIPTLFAQLEAQFTLEFPVVEVDVEEDVVKKEVEETIESEVVDQISEPLAETESRKEFIKSNSDDSRSWITKLSDRYFRSLDPTPAIVLIGSILAFILGVFHSVAPGHGKSIMAVLALAEHGRRREIYRLGVTMGATHTLGVFILGGLFIFGSNLVPQRTIPILGIISGTLIIAIGAFYLTKFIKHAQEHRNGHQHHHHHDKPVSGGRIALLGVVGGMVPTPTALTVLVGTAALGSAWYGVLLVACYGAGMTLVLIFAGRLIESLYRFGKNMVDSRSGARFVVERAPAIAATIQVIAGLFLAIISYGALI
jgi:ABC-type nickel/cobalt efflux system permease component RcnA